jgi:DNA repair protein RecO (recombination protein O)
MRKYKVYGLILKKRNYAESDKLITLFTQELGKLTLLAKGIRKISSKRAPNLDVLNYVVLTAYRGKTIDTLLEVSTLTSFSGIKNELKDISKAMELAEIIHLLAAEHEQNSELFHIFLEYLMLLEQGENPDTKEYIERMLDNLGYFNKNIHKPHEFSDYIEEITGKKLMAPHIYE